MLERSDVVPPVPEVLGIPVPEVLPGVTESVRLSGIVLLDPPGEVVPVPPDPLGEVVVPDPLGEVVVPLGEVPEPLVAPLGSVLLPVPMPLVPPPPVVPVVPAPGVPEVVPVPEGALGSSDLCIVASAPGCVVVLGVLVDGVPDVAGGLVLLDCATARPQATPSAAMLVEARNFPIFLMN